MLGVLKNKNSSALNIFAYSSSSRKMNGRNSELVSLNVEYLKPNESWCVRGFKCLDHDQMVESRICMSKVIYLSNMLLRPYILCLLDA